MTIRRSDGSNELPSVQQRSTFFEIMYERSADESVTVRQLRKFFNDSLELADGIPEDIAAGPPLDRRLIRQGGSIGEPGSPWGHISLKFDNPERRRQSAAVYSPSGWKRFLRRLSDPRLASTEVDFVRLSDTGRRHNAGSTVMLYYEAVPDDEAAGDWIRIGVMFDAVRLFDPDFVLILRTFIWSQVRTANPAFGLLAYEFRRTAFEVSLGALPSDNIPFMRATLRGHGWIMVIPPEIVQRMGGADELVWSRAFFIVERMPDGGCILQATKRFADYNEAAEQRIRTVLDPYLITREVIVQRRKLTAGS